MGSGITSEEDARRSPYEDLHDRTIEDFEQLQRAPASPWRIELSGPHRPREEQRMSVVSSLRDLLSTSRSTDPSPNPVRSATVLVTGAARGMGALFARRAAREGAAAIALWDLDLDGAEQLAAELTVQGVRAIAVRADMSSLDSIRAAAAETRAAVGTPTILVNNAGIVRGARFWEHDPEGDITATMAVNALGPMWLVREFLPEMMARPELPHRILNIASAAGVFANPRMSVYAASKWAVIGWAESLRVELEHDGHEHIAVTTFCPSFVATGMFEGARGPLGTPILSPAQAVDRAWAGMIRGTPLVKTPWTVKGGEAVKGLLPARAWDVLGGKVLRLYSSMDEFTGRSPEPPAEAGDHS
jgi:all-trans-retinol dehydrogenase (NAD+)